MSALPLGFFQFDNLIRSRVPFFLVRTSLEVESLFAKTEIMEKMHLRNCSVELADFSLLAAETELKERHAQKASPVVVLDKDGAEAKKLADELFKAGYLNVYFVLDGFKGLQSEKSLNS